MSAVVASLSHDDAMSSVATWAQSGLMSLTGAAEGPPALVSFDAMARIDRLLWRVNEALAMFGGSSACDVRLLTERAALSGLSRGGRSSCNRSCRLIETKNGWIAVNLPRPADLERLPAWIGRSAGSDPWRAVAQACRSKTSAELLAMAELLGLAVSEVASTTGRVMAAEQLRLPTQRIGAGVGGARDWRRNPPLVIDMSALWAGPLCGQLLAEAGARVIKVESVTRPDSIRASSPAFFDHLNAGKEPVALDLTCPDDRARLVSMIARADAVVSSARPRAFEQMGLQPEYLGSLNPGLTWIAVTAHGWAGEGRHRVGFGDDAAAAAGLLAFEGDRPMFVGDAIADPLTGIAATAAACDALLQGGGVLIDAALRAAASFVANAAAIHVGDRVRVARERDDWFVRFDDVSIRVGPPHARPCTGRAAGFGAHTQYVLKEFV